MVTQAKNPVKSTKVTFEIVEALKELNGAGITELAEHLEMTKGNVHNYLSTLQELEYVVRRDGTYHVGTQFLELGGYARGQIEIYKAASMEVNELAKETGEMASLLTEEHGRGTYLHVAGGKNAIPVKWNLVGTRVQLHGSALGKAILSELPDDRVDEILEAHGMPAFTENTITDPADLKSELEVIRDRGYAVDDEERSLGVRCIAAPITSETGQVLGAVSVTGPVRRMKDSRLEQEIPEMVRDAVNVIEFSVNLS